MIHTLVFPVDIKSYQTQKKIHVPAYIELVGDPARFHRATPTRAREKYILVDTQETDFLVSTIGLIARFWISEAAISSKSLSEEQLLQHYTRMVARIFLPYATAKGKRDLDELLVG